MVGSMQLAHLPESDLTRRTSVCARLSPEDRHPSSAFQLFISRTRHIDGLG